MDPHDDDIQFDFFEDEPATAEGPAPRGRLPRRPPRRPRGSVDPPRRAAPLVRLLALVFFVLFLVLVFAILVQSCTGSSKRATYSRYMGKVSTIAQQSTTDGKSAVTALTTPGLSVAQMVAKLRSIAAEEQQNVRAAQSLSSPGRLRDEHAHLIEALQLRVSGVKSLADTFQNWAVASSKSNDAAKLLAENATLLSEDAQRLLASDIVWDDLFKAPVSAQLQHDGVSGVDVPGSHFLASPDLIISTHAMSLVLQRIGGTSTTGTAVGTHGTNIVSVAALPNGTGGTSQVLTQGTLNTVTTSSSLVFQVTIHDGGDSQEVQIPVTLTIARPAAQGGPITKTAKVQLIDPGSDASVTFSDLGQVPFASQTTVSVDVAAVNGEKNKANNSAQYKVIFSLPS
jgi:hypothetical protein